MENNSFPERVGIKELETTEKPFQYFLSDQSTEDCDDQPKWTKYCLKGHEDNIHIRCLCLQNHVYRTSNKATSI